MSRREVCFFVFRDKFAQKNERLKKLVCKVSVFFSTQWKFIRCDTNKKKCSLNLTFEIKSLIIIIQIPTTLIGS